MTIPDGPPGKPPAPTGERPGIRLASPDGRPEIILTAEVHKTTAAMIESLRKDPELYQRGGSLVSVIRHEPDPKPKRRVRSQIPEGTPEIRNCPLSFLVNRVSEHARCLQKKRSGTWGHVSPPTAQVKAVLEQGSWRGIRRLAGVIEAPSMRPDGTVLQEPGHDDSTRFVYIPNDTFAPIPDSPSHSDAALAYAHLSDVFADFPYVNPSHLSATIASLLTLLARPAIEGPVPAWLFDAASKRSGKSLQVNVVSTIATGRPAPTMTYPENDEELEKVLAGFVLSGARIINFDNVARPFGGAALDKCITSVDEVQLRVLGSNSLPSVPFRAVIMASGNNATCRGDMLPRVLAPRIESPLENPESRTKYTHPDRAGEDKMLAWAREHRASLVVDSLTLLRAYVVAGRPEVDVDRWGGFGAWVSLVASALVWAGAPSPMGARRGLTGDDDPKAVAERGLVGGWCALCRAQGVVSMTASGAISHLYPPPKKDDPPDGFDDLREAIQDLTGARPGFPPATDRLSRALRALKGRPLAGLKLQTEGTTKGSYRWQAVPSVG